MPLQAHSHIHSLALLPTDHISLDFFLFCVRIFRSYIEHTPMPYFFLTLFFFFRNDCVHPCVHPPLHIRSLTPLSNDQISLYLIPFCICILRSCIAYIPGPFRFFLCFSSFIFLHPFLFIHPHQLVRPSPPSPSVSVSAVPSPVHASAPAFRRSMGVFFVFFPLSISFRSIFFSVLIQTHQAITTPFPILVYVV